MLSGDDTVANRHTTSKVVETSITSNAVIFPKPDDLVFYLFFAFAPSTVRFCLLQVLIEISD